MHIVYEKKTNKKLGETIDSLTEQLKENGFGVLWQLNFKDKLKEIIKRNKTMFADLDEIDKDMIIDYTIAGIIAVYQTWFRNNQNVSIDEISVKLSELSANGFNYFIKG